MRGIGKAHELSINAMQFQANIKFFALANRTALIIFTVHDQRRGLGKVDMG